MTETKQLTDFERFAFAGFVARLPEGTAYFWKCLLDHCEAKEIQANGHPVYRGDLWHKRIVAEAEAMLTALDVEWEHYAGHLYIAGKRIYWNSSKGRWEADDYR